MSNFEEQLLAVTNNEESGQVAALKKQHVGSYSLHNVRSMQLTRSSVAAGAVRRKKMSHCKLKKIKSPIQSYTKCKKFKHKPRLYDGEINKTERKRLKMELLNLIRQFHSTKEEDVLVGRIKSALCKIIDSSLESKKASNLKKDIMKHCLKDWNKEKRECRSDSYNVSVDGLKSNLKFILKKHTNDVTEIHRIIVQEMLPILKYHVFKEHENKVLKFVLSKIIKEIIGIVRNARMNHLANSNSCSEYRYHLNKLKEISGSKKLLYSMHQTSHVKRYRRYLNTIRKLMKSESPNAADRDNLMGALRDPIDLKIRSVINIYKALKRVQSTSYMHAQYVTNMLLNQFCKVDNEWTGVRCNGTVRRRTSTPKCLSDTYLMLRDTSKNKSVLTKSKFEMMHSCSRKLLASIKNKCAHEANVQRAKMSSTKESSNNPYRQAAVCVNDVPTAPLSFKAAYNKCNANGHDSPDIDNTLLLGQVESKVNVWLNKFGGDSTSTNKNCHNCILKDLTRDLVGQMEHLRLISNTHNIKTENVADYFRCVICKHLFVTFDDHNFELVKKVSELIKDLLDIYTYDESHLSQLKLHHQYLQLPSTSIERNGKNFKFVCPSPETRLMQPNSSLIEDIYLKLPFCDASARQVAPKAYSKEVGNYKITTSITDDVLHDRFKLLDVDEGVNRSGVINVALASTKSDKSESTAKNNKCNKSLSTTCRKKSGLNVSKSKKTMEQVDPAPVQTPDDIGNSPENMTRQQLHENCVEIFRNLCKELPILVCKPDLTELAREGVLHNALKIFYMLQDDPDVENSYTYFEMCFEDEIDGLLDMLPQTNEMKKMRQEWKMRLVTEAVKTFKIMKKTDDANSKQKCHQEADDQNSINEQNGGSEQEQRVNVLRLVDQFLSSANYQEQNSLNGRIYTERLINRAKEVYNSVKQNKSNPCCEMPADDLNMLVFKELEGVPKPNGDTIKDEIDLAKFNEVIEKWYNELPVMPTKTVSDYERKLITRELAQNIFSIEKCIDNLNDPSGERDIEEEVCMFLCSMIDKFDNKDLNINSMIEELVNNLRRLRRSTSLDYDSFQNNLPFHSSKIQQVNSSNAECNKQNPESYLIPDNNNNLNESQRNNFKIPNYISNNNTTGEMKDNIVRLRPIAKIAAKGILGTSQMAGPSSLQGSCCPKPRHSPTTASLYTPLISSTPRRNTYDSDHICGKSNWGPITSGRTNSISLDTRASTRFSRKDFNQNPDNHLMRESVTRPSFNQNNYQRVQGSSSILPIGRPTYGAASIAQVPTFIPVQRTDNNLERDRGNTYQIESERERDVERVRCRCGDRQFRKRRRYECCCDDYYSMPHCCLLPYERYF